MKRKNKILLFFTALLSALVACSQGDFDKMVDRTVDSETPYVYPDSINYSKDLVFLDAREKEEFDVSHIEGARYIGHKSFDLASLSDLDKSTPIVVYCSIGYRSGKIGDQLVEAGFTDVKNLYGGIFYWINNGHELVNEKGVTQNIHGYNRIWKRWVKKGKVQI